jgi:hypothetical protein
VLGGTSFSCSLGVSVGEQLLAFSRAVEASEFHERWFGLVAGIEEVEDSSVELVPLRDLATSMC